jgi:hypothetical protein
LRHERLLGFTPGFPLWRSVRDRRESSTAIIRDFPDGLRPTTAVGLSGESITDRETGKHFFCSAEEESGLTLSRTAE